MVAPFALLLASLSLIQYVGSGIDLMLVRYPAKLLCDAKYVSKSLSHLWVRAKPAKQYSLVPLCTLVPVYLYWGIGAIT